MRASERMHVRGSRGGRMKISCHGFLLEIIQGLRAGMFLTARLLAIIRKPILDDCVPWTGRAIATGSCLGR